MVIRYTEDIEDMLSDFYLYGFRLIKLLSKKSKCILNMYNSGYAHDHYITIYIELVSIKNSHIATLVNTIFINPNTSNVTYCKYDAKTQNQSIASLIIKPKQNLANYLFSTDGLKMVFDNYHKKPHYDQSIVNYFLDDLCIRKLIGIDEIDNDNDLI